MGRAHRTDGFTPPVAHNSLQRLVSSSVDHLPRHGNHSGTRSVGQQYRASVTTFVFVKVAFILVIAGYALLYTLLFLHFIDCEHSPGEQERTCLRFRTSYAATVAVLVFGALPMHFLYTYLLFSAACSQRQRNGYDLC